MDITIIGGGISGLYLCYLLTLQKDFKNYNVIVYEKKKNIGGRIKTKYNNENEILYETGPWRIALNHTRMISLIKKLNLKLIKIRQEKKKEIDIIDNNLTISHLNTTEMTEYQYRCIKNDSISKTNLEMQMSGYDNLFERANTTRSYSNKTLEDEEEFYVVEEGFSEIIERLKIYLDKFSNIKIQTDCNVVDIKYNNHDYILNIKNRGNGNMRRKTSILILAIPVHNMREWKGLNLDANTSMVSSYPLIHVMGKVSNNFTKEQFKIVCSSPISQIIQSCYNNNWIQLSYAGGRFAEMMQNLIVNGSFTKYIKKEFKKYFPKEKIRTIIPYFWRNAVHYWRPNIKTTEQNLKSRSIYPHPRKYKKLFCIGESISSIQGWMEGALETAEDVMSIMRKEPKINENRNFEYVIYDGRIIDVSKWINVHPGGKETICNHLYEDITDLWNVYHDKEVSRYLIMLESR